MKKSNLGDNSMSLKNDILEVKKEYEELKEMSCLIDLLRVYKKENKRLRYWLDFIVVLELLTLSFLICVLYHI